MLRLRLSSGPPSGAAAASGRARPPVPGAVPVPAPVRPAPVPDAPPSTSTAAQRTASVAAAQAAVARTRALASELDTAKARISELEAELASLRPAPAGSEHGPSTTTTILYKTGWEAAYAHCSIDGGEWGDIPLPAPRAADGHWRALTIPSAGRVRCVFTDGRGSWDSPDPYAPQGSHYAMDGGGVFTVRRGRCARVEVPAGQDGEAGGWAWVE